MLVLYYLAVEPSIQKIREFLLRFLMYNIRYATAARKPDLVEMLLSRGADVDATQAGGWTALHAAAKHGDLEIVKILLARGAQKLPSEGGETPVDLVEDGSSEELRQALTSD